MSATPLLLTQCSGVCFRVRLGESNTESPIDCDAFGVCAPPHQDIGIKGYKFGNYCRTINVNDIMLIELEKPAELNGKYNELLSK